MRLIRSISVGLFLVLALSFSAAAQSVRVLILPFDTHSNVDISQTRRGVMDAIAASLDSSGAEIAGMESVKELVLKRGEKRFSEESAYMLAESVRADFAVLGSITRLGNTADVSWRVVDLREKGTVAFYFKSASTDEELRARVAEAGQSMYEKMTSVIKARPAARSGVIDRIVISGNRRVDTQAVLKKVTSRTGEPFSPDDVKEDIRAIYGTGFFDEVSAGLADTASGKVLTFYVKETPFIKKVSFRGNKEIKDEKIKDALTIKENTALDRVLLGENAEKIKAMYAEEGYYLASVKPAIDSDGLEAAVTFEINEGPEVKVKRITFIGNKFFKDKKLKGFMTTSEVGFFSVFTQSGKFNEFVFQNDLAVIMGKYYDNGFINADIVDHRVLLSEDKKWFYITVAVTEGEQYRIGKVDVKGDLIVPREELFEKFKLEKGDVFNRTKLSRWIDAVTEVYGDKGYAYADIKPLTSPDPAARTLDITLDIRKNDLVYIEKIDIMGNVRTRDKVIRRELELEETDLFSTSKLKRSRNNLRRLGYFEDVRISQNQGSGTDKMKLGVDVKERPTGSISVGVGYSSVDKLIGTASIAQSNLMGTGIKLDLSGTLSSKSSRYVLGFTEPWLFDKPLSAGIDLYNTDRTYPDFKLRKNGFDVRFGFPVADRYTRGYLTYKFEDVHISDVAAGASSFIKEQAGKSTESSFKAAVRRDTRDDAFFPSEGSVLQASAEVAGGPLGGTSYFIKYEGDAVKYFPLFWDTTFSIRGGAGYIQGFQGRVAPIYERYFLGGINSIRGFETRSVGPKDSATGDLIGGSTMMIMNAEFLFPIFPQQNIKGLLFFDAGNAYKGRVDFSEIRKGAGVGIRWFSPIGPLRLELGFNIDKKPGEKSQQWDFAVGTIF